MSVKTLGIILGTTAGIAVVGGGVAYAVSPEFRDFVGLNVEREFSSSYDFYGTTLDDGRVLITGYYGTTKHLQIPSSVSFGELKEHQYSFASIQELEYYINDVVNRYTKAEDFDGDYDAEIFKYSFLYNDLSSMIVVKSLNELMNMTAELYSLSDKDKEKAFPITHTGLIQTYTEGDDHAITAVVNLGKNVQSVNIPAGILEVDYVNLARNGTTMYFSEDNETYGTWVTKNGCLIDTKTQTLKMVYPGTIKGDSYTTPSDLKAIDMFSFDLYRETLKTLNISEGVLAVSGTLDMVDIETTRRLVINMPESLTTINTTAVVTAQNAKDNIVVFLKSLATIPGGQGVNVFAYAGDDPSRALFVVTDEIYAQILEEYPDFKSSGFQIISYSAYVAG